MTIPVYGGADGISTETVQFGVLGRVILALGRWRSTAGLGRDPRGDLGHSWGARFLWPSEIGRQVAALIRGARFAVMQDAGHFPHLQAPQSLVRLAREFLGD